MMSKDSFTLIQNIYPDIKGVIGAIIIRITATRCLNLVILMQSCCKEKKNQ